MSSAVNSRNNSLLDSLPQSRVCQGLEQIEKLEQQLASEEISAEEIETVASSIIELASHSIDYLSPEERADFEKELEEIDDESVLEETPSVSSEEECKKLENTSANPEKAKKKRGFLASKFNQIRHAAKKIGRVAVKIADTGLSRPISFRPPSLLGRATTQGRSLVQLKKIAHKVHKFVKKHKKELIIGAVVAAVVIAGVVVATTSSSAAAAGIGGIAGAGGISSSSSSSAVASQQRSQGVTSSEQSIARVLDSGQILRQDGFKRAEQLAMQERFPGLVHDVNKVDEARKFAERALSKFKTDLIQSVDSKDIEAAILLGVSVGTMPVKGPVALLSAGIVGAQTSRLVKEYGDRIQALYKPAGESYEYLYKIEEENKRASLLKCESIGYKPKLEFHADFSVNSASQVTFIDKNNPNPDNRIMVEISDENE